MDVLEAITKNNPNLLKIKLDRTDFDINATIYESKGKSKKKVAISSPLVYACEKQTTDSVKLLIKNGANVNIEDDTHRTPLYVAALNGNLDIIKILIIAQADVNKLTDSGHSALHGAVEKEHTEVLRYLINQNANVNIKKDNCDIGTPLYYATTTNKSMDGVKVLLENGAEVDFKQDGTTPFINAVQNGKLKIMEALLDGGADINACDKSGKSALHLAVINGKAKCLRSLLKRNADVNKKFDGQTPLRRSMLLRTWPSLETVDINLLVDKHTKEELQAFGPGEKKDDLECSVLMLAARHGNEGVVAHIADKVDDVMQTNKNGDTALHYVFFSQTRSPGEVRLEALLKHGADPMGENSSGITPFYYLLKGRFNNRYNTHKFLALMLKYSKNINLNQRDYNQDTPLLLAAGAQNPRRELLEFLIDNGADKDAVNRDGQSALHFACLQAGNVAGSDHHKKISPVRLLLEKGVKIQLNNSDLYPQFLCRYWNDYQAFVDNKIDINMQNKKGDTIMHSLIKTDMANTRNQFPFKFRDLLDVTKKHDLTIENKDGKTVFDLVKEYDNHRVKSALEKLTEYVEKQTASREKAKAKKENLESLSSKASSSTAKALTAGKTTTKSSPASNAKLKKTSATQKTKPTTSSTVKKSQTTSKTFKTQEKTPSATKTKSSTGAAAATKKTKSNDLPALEERKVRTIIKQPKSTSHASLSEVVPPPQESLPIKTNTTEQGDEKKADVNENPINEGKVSEQESNEDPQQSIDVDEKTTTSQSDAKDVMISYQWDSQKIAIKLRDYLVKTGKLDVWMDVTDMSKDMNEAMAKGVAFSTVFIMCMSQKYADSVNCKKEFSYADRLRKHIIPVKVQSDFTPALGTALDLIVGANIYYDLDADYNNQIGKLLNDVKKYIEGSNS